jgi:hypothetical protein
MKADILEKQCFIVGVRFQIPDFTIHSSEQQRL